MVNWESIVNKSIARLIVSAHATSSSHTIITPSSAPSPSALHSSFTTNTSTCCCKKIKIFIKNSNFFFFFYQTSAIHAAPPFIDIFPSISIEYASTNRHYRHYTTNGKYQLLSFLSLSYCWIAHERGLAHTWFSFIEW